MKKIIALFAAGTILLACAEKEQPKGNLQLTGKIDGLKQGLLYIQKLEDTTLVVLDSIRIGGDSSFKSDLDIKSPEMLYLFLDRGTSNSIDNSLLVFAEPGAINIETSLERFYADSKITGSKNHDLYEEFKKVNSRFTGQQLDLAAEQLNAYKEKKAVSMSENEAKADRILKKKYLYAINFAINNKDKEVAPFVALSEINDAGTPFLDTIFKSLTPEIAASKYGKLLEKHIAGRKQSEKQ